MLLLPRGVCVELKVTEYKLSEKAGSARDGDYFSIGGVLEREYRLRLERSAFGIESSNLSTPTNIRKC